MAPVDQSPAGLSTVTTIGLLILAIGALAAVGAWLLAWYRGRQEEAEDPNDPGEGGEPGDPGDPVTEAPAPEAAVAPDAETDPTDKV